MQWKAVDPTESKGNSSIQGLHHSGPWELGPRALGTSEAAPG